LLRQEFDPATRTRIYTMAFDAVMLGLGVIASLLHPTRVSEPAAVQVQPTPFACSGAYSV
jgi:hypothetical protein